MGEPQTLNGVGKRALRQVRMVTTRARIHLAETAESGGIRARTPFPLVNLSRYFPVEQVRWLKQVKKEKKKHFPPKLGNLSLIPPWKKKINFQNFVP